MRPVARDCSMEHARHTCVAAAKVRGRSNGNETTPTFDINGTIIVDFDQARLRAALGKK